MDIPWWTLGSALFFAMGLGLVAAPWLLYRILGVTWPHAWRLAGATAVACLAGLVLHAVLRVQAATPIGIVGMFLVVLLPPPVFAWLDHEPGPPRLATVVLLAGLTAGLWLTGWVLLIFAPGAAWWERPT